MAKRFRLSEKQNIKIPVPEKFQARFGMYIKSEFKPVHRPVAGISAEPKKKI